MAVLHLVLLLLAVAAAVSIIVERLHFPYTIALVITGLVIGNLHLFPAIPIKSEVLLTLLIPPLLFEGGLRLPPELLRRYWALIGLLAIPGTIIVALFIGLVSVVAFHLDVRSALLLGAIAAAIDPVSVIAVVREAGLDVRLGTILEGEAVLNDGVAIVLVTVLSGSAVFSFPTTTWQFSWLIVIGSFVGVSTAIVISHVMGRTNQPPVEALGSLIVAIASFVAAESLSTSGVVAVASAGVVFGSYGCRSLTEAGRETIRTLWDMIAFLANSILFLLIGLQVPSTLLIHHWGVIVILIVTALVIRVATVYGFSAVSQAFSRPIERSWRHVLVWSGLRGGVAIALALGLDQRLPGREVIIAGIFGIIVFTLLGQGLSIRPLMRRVGLLN
jgi:CPA1 family monovalent cation:H+ antiporter